MLSHAFFLTKELLGVAVKNAGKGLRLTCPCMLECIIILKRSRAVLALEFEVR